MNRQVRHRWGYWRRLLGPAVFLWTFVCAPCPHGPDPVAAAHAGPLAALCAVTFDDGPGRYTRRLLDALKARDAKVTFFVLGEQVRREPDVVRRMAAEGHEVANHSFDHPDFRHLSPAEQQREIDATQSALRSLGIEPKYFRPPYGNYEPETIRAAARDGLTVVLWTADGEDWRYHTVHALEAHVDQELKVNVGGIYLFHDIHPWTVAAIPEILDRVAEGGCRFVTLSQFLASKRPAGASGSGYPWVKAGLRFAVESCAKERLGERDRSRAIE